MRTLLALFALFVAAPLQAAPPAKLQQFTVTVDGHPLALWARVVAKPKGNILLIHGRTWSSLPDFDLHVSGKQRSVMEMLNARGYSAYALDLPGYGKSPRYADGWLTPDIAANDTAAVLEWLAREKKVARPALLGWSMGSLVVQLTAQRHPELISNLVLYGYPIEAAAKMSAQPQPTTPAREATTREAAASDFISPQVIDQKTIDTYVAVALAADPVRNDWRSLDQFAELDPAKVITPVLLMHGERDPLASVESQAKAFTRFKNPDRQWVILAGGDHAALLEDTAPAFVAAVVAFVERPVAAEKTKH
jgi:pimeloyl-ACP methyl ester carboxylesterase